MKRRLLVIAVFLIAGAVVNVAVAWGCAFPQRKGFGTMSRVEDADKETVLWRRYAAEDWVYQDTIKQEWFGATVTTSAAPMGSPAYGTVAAFEYGWPTRSVRYVARVTIQGGIAKSETFGAWRVGRGVPLIPLWPGFAINTIFYAALLCLPFVVRRFVRVRRGLCPKCAYPMGESAVCTECGKALSERANVTT